MDTNRKRTNDTHDSIDAAFTAARNGDWGGAVHHIDDARQSAGAAEARTATEGGTLRIFLETSSGRVVFSAVGPNAPGTIGHNTRGCAL